MKRRRLKTEVRRDEVLQAALDAAAASSYRTITRTEIAERAGCSPGLVSAYFGTMPALRRSIMRAAATGRSLPVLAQGLADRNSYALDADPDLRRRAAEGIA